MKILDKLKGIGLYFPKLKGFSLLRISVNIDHSTHVEGSTVTINPQKLSGKQKRALKQIIKTEALEEAGAIVDESNSETIEEVVKALPSIEETSKKFLPIIPAADVPLLHACLFLCKKYENGDPVENLKGQIVRVYGTRGGNFANLCSAGYLQTWFLPIYDELLRAHPDNPAEAKERFLALYKAILNELPWTEFVPAGASASKVTRHIIEKMTRNIANGVRYLNVHGLGEKNVAKILGILPEIQKQIGAIAIRIDRDPRRIFVRLEIPAQISN